MNWLYKRLPLLALSLLVLAGCKREDPRLEVVPAEGKLLFRGHPPVGAEVTLLPMNDSSPDAVKPYGFVEDDGTFRLTTYPSADGKKDGAPPGDYYVGIRWTARAKTNDAIELQMPSGGTEVGPPGGPQADRFGDRYSNPKTSGLKVRVEAGKTLGTLNLE